ncbi:hypothetical protein Bbelb_244950 [Branchiostoma belcheri]|nr:hypothetical protein Bbelb_244950 [Branchiostoma belcheri]
MSPTRPAFSGNRQTGLAGREISLKASYLGPKFFRLGRSAMLALRKDAAGGVLRRLSKLCLLRKRVVSTTTMFGRRSGLFSAIRERRVWGASDRHGVRGSTRGKLDSVISGFVCTRGDEYVMEDQVAGHDFRVDCELCRHWGLSRRTGAKQNCAGGVEERRGRSRFFAGAKQNGAGAKRKEFHGGAERVALQRQASAKVSASGSQEHKNSGAGTARQKLNLVYGVLHDSVSCIIIHKDYLSRPRLLPPYDLLGDQCLARGMYCVSVTGMGSFDSIVQSLTSAMASFQVTASGDKTARMWDMESTNLMGVFKGHTKSGFSAQEPEIGISWFGMGDAIIMQHYDGVTCVVYQDENTIVSAGSMADGPCGTIKLWDMRKNYTAYQYTPIPKHSFPCPRTCSGSSSLVVDSAGTRLFASCTHIYNFSTDSAIYMYNCHSMETQPVATFTGHGSSFDVRCALSPCEEYLLISGPSDASAYIWKVNDPEACPWKLTGHRAAVTAVAWCQDDFTKLITCSDDDIMRVWRHQPLTDKERDPNDVVGDVQRVVRTPQKSAGTWKPETFDSGVRTVGVGSPRMATTVSNKVPTANAASPKHAAGASPNAEAVATAGQPTPENEQS